MVKDCLDFSDWIETHQKKRQIVYTKQCEDANYTNSDQSYIYAV